MQSTGESNTGRSPTGEDQDTKSSEDYWRFGAMILTAMAAMFVLMYVNTFELDHVKWSETAST